ncbi:MAG TPA: hypothetical protein VGS11_11255 [Candidatus Bathyarchaeia archaeon]|nr:hypothetical protein [Candidatus Bathyarchaeia archaeon]
MSRGLRKIRALEDLISAPRLSNYCFHRVKAYVKDFKNLYPLQVQTGNRFDWNVTLTIHTSTIESKQNGNLLGEHLDRVIQIG